jgi:hypothetical protein
MIYQSIDVNRLLLRLSDDSQPLKDHTATTIYKQVCTNFISVIKKQIYDNYLTDLLIALATQVDCLSD